MKVWPAIAMMLTLMAPVYASAQESIRWMHPSGGYSLDYGLVGFRLGEPFSYDGVVAIATFDPGCVIFDTPVQSSRPLTQKRANAFIEGHTPAAKAAGLGYRPEDVVAFERATLSGITVATLIVDHPPSNRRLRSYYRYFILVNGGEARYQEISCGTHSNDGVRTVRSVTDFLATLQINASRTTL